MTDIVEFLKAELDVDEQLARAAGATRSGKVASWHVDCGCGDVHADNCYACRVEGDNITIYDEGGHDEDQARHIARWDPVRVLAEVEAKRAILADHPRSPLLDMTESELHAHCAHPAYEYATTQGQRKAWDYSNEAPDGEGWERNVDAGNPGEGWERFDYHEESYWRRLNPDGPRPAYVPKVLRQLAAPYADRPGFKEEWKL